MDPLFQKLNFKSQDKLLVLHAPEGFGPHVQAMKALAEVLTQADEVHSPLAFAMAFVTTQAQVDQTALQLAPWLEGDVTLWFCYPKGSSKRYRCDFNRDTGWAVLGTLGFEPVRQVAIDEDWSALRFRRVQYIRTITRHADGTLTEEARQRTIHPSKGPQAGT